MRYLVLVDALKFWQVFYAAYCSHLVLAVSFFDLLHTLLALFFQIARAHSGHFCIHQRTTGGR